MTKKRARHLQLVPPPVQPMLPFETLPPALGQKIRPLVVRKLANAALARMLAEDEGKPLPAPGEPQKGSVR